MNWRRIKRIEQALKYLERIKHSERVERGRTKLSERKIKIKEAAEHQMQLMKQDPPSKYYNVTSALMIGVGGIGMSLMLKYQERFKELIPEWMHVEQPDPGNEEKIYIGKQSQYYYSQSLYF